MLFERKSYLQRLISADGNGMIKIITGIRRRHNAERKSVRSSLEIDFVVNRHDERLYIQSAYSLPDQEKLNQEQAALLQVSDNFKKIIIVGDKHFSNYNEAGIQQVGIYDFLLNIEKCLPV